MVNLHIRILYFDRIDLRSEIASGHPYIIYGTINCPTGGGGFLLVIRCADEREEKIDEIEYQYMELITLKPFDYKKSQKHKPN